ncbi:unnamed protein product, partial [Didymodactylos carnosus]
SVSTAGIPTDLTAAPYYQVYEQIGNNDTTLGERLDDWTRTNSNRTLLCLFHQQPISTPTLPSSSTTQLLRIIVLDQEHLKQLLVPTNSDKYETVVNLYHLNRIESLNIFYSLLKLDGFLSAFIYQTLLNNSSYMDLYNVIYIEIREYFHIFDDFIRILIDYLVDYDDFTTLRVNVPLSDIDTIEQLWLKIVRYINAYQLETRIKPDDVELYLNQIYFRTYHTPLHRELRGGQEYMCFDFFDTFFRSKNYKLERCQKRTFFHLF